MLPIIKRSTFLVLIAACFAIGAKKTDYTAVRLKTPLKIDGILDEERYQGKSIDHFIQNEPLNGEPPSQKTEVWISYTETDLYISARMHDTEAELIRDPQNRRDQLNNTDEFQTAIDSYHDRRSGFFFIVTPSGSYQDGTIYNDSFFDDSWDGVWYRGTSRDENGWNVELRIPFSQLNFEYREEQIMAISFGRFIERNKEHDIDVHIPRGETGIVSRFTDLRGIRNIKPPRKIEVMPYTTGGYSLLPELDDHPLYKGKNTRTGLGADLKIGLGNNLTLSGTINPDFGQVEVDPSVINLSASETYYSEKRPFFIEGANIFSFGRGGPSNRMSFMYMQPNLFYSRRIGAPPRGILTMPEHLADKLSGQSYDIYEKSPGETSILGAGKLTGKLNNTWSTGVFAALTAEEPGEARAYSLERRILGKWREPVEPGAGYYMARTLGEFEKGLRGLGFMGTLVQRNLDTDKLDSLFTRRALTGGVDGWYFLNDEKSWVLSGFMTLSRVEGSPDRLVTLQTNSLRYYQRPDAGHLSVDSTLTEMTGYSGRVMLTKESGDIIFNASTAFASPGFEPNDMGLLFTTDRINNQLIIGYSWNEPNRYFNYGNLIFAKATNHNFSGQKINSMNFLTGFFRFHNEWRTYFIGGAGPRTLSDQTLRGGPMVISPFGWFSDFSIMTDARKKTQFRFSVGGGGSELGARNYSLETEIEIQLGTRLKLEMEPNFSKSTSISQYVTVFDDSQRTEMYGRRYIVSHLDQERLSMEFRADLALTPDLSIQSYIQPFFAVGHYSRFKEFEKPETYSFIEYEEGQNLYAISYNETSGSYLLQPDGPGTRTFYLSNPDFNVKSLVGNFVLRWEFKPGSTLYIVWTRNHENYDHPGDLSLTRDARVLLKSRPENHFAIKLTYWFGQ